MQVPFQEPAKTEQKRRFFCGEDTKLNVMYKNIKRSLYNQKMWRFGLRTSGTAPHRVAQAAVG